MPKTKVSFKRTKPPLTTIPDFESSGYEEAVQGLDAPRMQKVSVTVDRGLLSFVDHFVQNHKDLTRSEIFDRALAMWAKQAQKQADNACYLADNLTDKQKKAAADWSAIQTEAARYIW